MTTKDLYTPDFEHWYKAYPRHEGKLPAAKAWAKLDDGQRAAALVDVQKRTRKSAWSSNKKLVAMPATYLNAHRWLDDWEETLESSSDRGGEFQSQGAVNFTPTETVRMSKWKIAMNRLAFRWMWAARGLEDPEVDRFRDILLEYLHMWEVPCNADFEAAETSEERNRIAMEFGASLLDILDQEFGRNLKDKVINMRRVG